jgi:hypothetical protein
MKKMLPILWIFLIGSSYAGERVTYQNWVVDISGNTSEAYTANESSSSLGMYCAADKCLLYLHQPLQCQPGRSYSVLLNSALISSAVSIQCTQVGNNLFEILDPFNAVFNAVQSGGVIGFAVALQSGAFAVTTFNLAGANDAIRRVLIEAKTSKPSIPKTPDAKPISPGIRNLKDINI